MPVMRPTRSLLLSIHTASLLAMLAVIPSHAQSLDRHKLPNSQEVPAIPSAIWEAVHVNHMMGMPDVHPKSDGQLWLTNKEIRFDSVKGGYGTVPVASIIAVYNGDEEVEKGGTPVRLARMFIPYGAGTGVAAVYHEKIGLLTIEFRDNNGAYHGMVFRMPIEDAATGLTQLAALIKTTTEVPSHLTDMPCGLHSFTTKTVVVNPIVSEIKTGGVALPAEYKVLVYEYLVQKLETKAGLNQVYRFGFQEQHCANYSVDVTIRAFKKGNNAVRASTSYLGAFIGTTQLAYHLRITDADGQVLIEKDLKKTVRGERESLDVTDQIAKATAKSLAKSSKKQ